MSSFRWAVTGTPCVKAFSDLQGQLGWLGHGHSGNTSNNLSANLRLLGTTSNKSMFAEVIGALQTLMIRHSKAQRISGDVALKLPDLECETVWLTMDGAEKRDYAVAHDTDRLSWANAVTDGVTSWTATLRLRRKLAYCSTSDRKLQALVGDLNSLRQKEPHMHVVVFTQSVAAHKRICQSVQRAGFTVYDISGGSNIKQRHQSIRDFQKAESKPKVFVLTMKTGNCGITLTAATRVYLMEPCIDPAHEQQAAGRIHRLGQLKDVMCKRFCLRDTYEEQVVELHTQLKSGKASLTDGRLSGQLFQLLTRK